jgi:hypothetical protein
VQLCPAADSNSGSLDVCLSRATAQWQGKVSTGIVGRQLQIKLVGKMMTLASELRPLEIDRLDVKS